MENPQEWVFRAGIKGHAKTLGSKQPFNNSVVYVWGNMQITENNYKYWNKIRTTWPLLGEEARKLCTKPSAGFVMCWQGLLLSCHLCPLQSIHHEEVNCFLKRWRNFSPVGSSSEVSYCVFFLKNKKTAKRKTKVKNEFKSIKTKQKVNNSSSWGLLWSIVDRERPFFMSVYLQLSCNL